MKRVLSCKRGHYLTRASVFLLIAALIAGMIGCDGYNPPSQDLEIRDWYDLDAIRDNLDGNHKLVNSLNSATPGYAWLASPTANGGKGWEPIGCQPTGASYSFRGNFDGQGYEIHDLYINRAYETTNNYETVNIGLFSVVHKEGRIENVGVVDATVIGIACVGGLAGSNSGNVNNCYFTGSVTGELRVGGLVGLEYSTGDVSDSYFTGSVTGERLVGGLVGDRSGTISNSHYNYDEVLINGDNIITRGALFDEDFDQWLANDKSLDFSERLSQEDGYYLVNNVTDFKQLLAFGQNASLKFRLENDLDLGTQPNFYIPYLAGEFDGDGHKISNLSFNFNFVSHVGLFGQLASGGKVTQVGVENLNITGTRLVGGLVGLSEGTVSHCDATGSVAGSSAVSEAGGYDERVGGLVGDNDQGTIGNSYFTGSVSGHSYVGGLVGYSSGDVSNSHFTGSVVGWDNVGGFVGWNIDGTVSNCHSTGSLTGRETFGGLVGNLLSGTVSNSYSTCSVTGYAVSWGGMVGWCAGGLVGFNHEGTVSDSYCTGNVTGVEWVGGLVGRNFDYATVSNSYSTGSVTGDSNVGGLVGQNTGTVSNSFWDIETSGQATSDGGTGKTTAQMKDIATFSGAGWNIVAVVNPGTRNPSYIWNIVDDATYPFLSWQPV
jgi:hypothetical protein